jgi:hypothetical protein
MDKEIKHNNNLYPHDNIRIFLFFKAAEIPFYKF